MLKLDTVCEQHFNSRGATLTRSIVQRSLLIVATLVINGYTSLNQRPDRLAVTCLGCLAQGLPRVSVPLAPHLLLPFPVQVFLDGRLVVP